MIKQKLSFEKPPLAVSEQIKLLQKRGLIIDNIELCEAALTYIGYYRLSGYVLPFCASPGENHLFVKNTKFEQIIEHYEFDRELRLLCLNVIERIEIAFRAIVSDYMSLYAGNSHWYERKDYFKDDNYHSELLFNLTKKIGRPAKTDVRVPKEKFLEHYYKTYNFPDLPPSWMVFETMSFGDIIFLFKNLKNPHKKRISGYFGLDDAILHSWIHSVCYLRNLCAHHSRVWNRKMSICPKISRKYNKIQFSDKNKYFYGQVIILKILLDKIFPDNKWISQLDTLISSFPGIRVERMGFPMGWKKLVDNID